MNAGGDRRQLLALLAISAVCILLSHIVPSTQVQTPTGGGPTAGTAADTALTAGFSSSSAFIYIASYSKGFVDVVNISSLSIVKRIGLNLSSAYPTKLCFSPATRDIYVSDAGSQTKGLVSIIDTKRNRLAATVSVNGTTPNGCLYDPANHQVFIADYGSQQVSVLDSNNVLVKVISVGILPNGLAYDSRNGTMFVVNAGCSCSLGFMGSISVITSRGDRIVANISLGNKTYPSGIAYDPVHDRIYVNNACEIWAYNATDYKRITTSTFSCTGQFPNLSTFDIWTSRLYIAGPGIVAFNTSSLRMARTVLSNMSAYQLVIGAPHHDLYVSAGGLEVFTKYYSYVSTVQVRGSPTGIAIS